MELRSAAATFHGRKFNYRLARRPANINNYQRSQTRGCPEKGTGRDRKREREREREGEGEVAASDPSRFLWLQESDVNVATV